MSVSQSPRVTVRVEVVVEGGEAKVSGAKWEVAEVPAPAPKLPPHFGRFVPFNIVVPSTSSTAHPVNTPVYTLNGSHVIEACGTCPPRSGSGSMPSRVWARAYPDPTVAAAASGGASGYAAPPSGTMSVVPDSSGNWSFLRSAGKAIAESAYNTSPPGANNSSLVVWYQYDGSSHYGIEATAYYGFLSTGSGSGPCTHPFPTPLTVTFLGELASLGSVTLTWDGTGWTASVPNQPREIHFLRLGREYRLLLVGPEGVIAATGQQACHTPFVWSGEGTTGGGDRCAFRVTVTE